MPLQKAEHQAEFLYSLCLSTRSNTADDPTRDRDAQKAWNKCKLADLDDEDGKASRLLLR